MSHAPYLAVHLRKNTVKGLGLPPERVAGVLPLVSFPGRNDFNFALEEDSVGVGHEGFAAEVDPAFN